MNRYEILSRFFKKNKQYDFVSQSNESQQKPNAHFQAVGFDVNMDLLKKIEPYRKYYTKETSQSNSIEESYNRLSTAAEQAKIISKNFEAVDSNRISGKSMEGFKREMVNKLKDKFYLSDYLHYWLNIETEKSKNLKRTSTNSPWIEGLEENIRLRYTLLYNCLDGSLPNRKLNEHAVEEIISRIAPRHYKINETVEKYYKYRKAVLSTPVPSITERKPIDLARLEELKQTLSDKKKTEEKSKKSVLLVPSAEKLR
ncbi:hypothetical protein [Enterococcus faecium]|uniref:hypothetical protein n=1 Tax=Enterococcus faecium TaxID=1352 RepID=UPI0023B243E1|nr:hypothetical protein [Enterococcus faecium]